MRIILRYNPDSRMSNQIVKYKKHPELRIGVIRLDFDTCKLVSESRTRKQNHEIESHIFKRE